MHEAAKLQCATMQGDMNYAGQGLLSCKDMEYASSGSLILRWHQIGAWSARIDVSPSIKSVLVFTTH